MSTPIQFNGSGSSLPAGVYGKEIYQCKYGSMEKLTPNNYHTWKSHMSHILEAEGALEIVLGNVNEPPHGAGAAAEARLDKYQTRVGKAKTHIYGSCHASIQPRIQGKSAQDMWSALKDEYDKASTISGRFLVHNRFENLRFTEGTLSEFIGKMMDCRNELAFSDKPIDDDTFIRRLLRNLPKDIYGSIIQVILAKPVEELTVENVNKWLQSFEAERLDEQKEPTATTSIPRALTATSFPSNRGQRHSFHGRRRGYRWGRGNGRGRGGNSNSNGSGSQSRGNSGSSNRPTCWYCLQQGHRQNDCPLRKAANHQRNIRREGHQPRDTDQKPPPNSNSTGNQNSGSSSSNSLSSGGVAFATCMMATVSVSGKEQWALDSGASHHFCRRLEDFVPGSITELNSPINIITAAGTTTIASSSGIIRFQLPSGRLLEIEALYVPSFRSSLLSIELLAESQPLTYIDWEWRMDGELIGERRDGVKYFLGRALQLAIPSEVPFATTLDLWHQRLAHLNKPALKLLLDRDQYSIPANASDPGSFCVTCVRAKHQRKIIRQPVLRTTQPFQLVHSDLGGPITPVSYANSRYFILYIDDYSRYTWVFFLKTKGATEITGRFQEFKARMELLFPDTRIGRFRCDNGKGEYNNNLFRGILRTSGVSYEPAPPYTQHKNGVAERMIRTLCTKARAMLIDSRMDDEFWVEAVNTATYLHARSPSHAIENKTPYELLNGYKPELSHLRRFGCAAYKLIPDAQRSGKFSSRASDCVMIGYIHNTTKIWRLWHLEGKRMIMASDVRFDESVVMGKRPID